MTAAKATSPGPFLTRLQLRNYKSIGACDVTFQRFTALVGPNGSGKSNILDSLRFLAEALRSSLDFALRDRGGINEVRRRSGGHPNNFALRLDAILPDGAKAVFSLKIGATTAGGFRVSREQCYLSAGAKWHWYDVKQGEVVRASEMLHSAVEPDRLYLAAVSAVPTFRPLYDALKRMGFYNVNPESIRNLQAPSPEDVLARDGQNAASVLGRLHKSDPETKHRLEQYLEAIVPGVRSVDLKVLGPKQTIEFRQQVPGADRSWRFLAANMSDGTLRAFGVLLAMFQRVPGSEQSVPLVGIEEPESALHPAAAATLMEATLEASRRSQVLVTSHSPDLLDSEAIASENILAVVSEDGETKTAPVSQAARRALREGLYTPGELLRLKQIEPDRSAIKAAPQLDLFPRTPTE